MRLAFQIQDDVWLPYDAECVEFTERQQPNSIHYAEIKHQSQKDARSLAQNRMSHKWYRDLATQGDMTALEYRSYCKLHFGVPLLRIVDESFMEQYDDCIRPLEYDQKINLMGGAINLPVTSRMDVETMAKYLKAMSDHFLLEGFQLTTFEHLTEWLAEDAAKHG